MFHVKHFRRNFAVKNFTREKFHPLTAMMNYADRTSSPRGDADGAGRYQYDVHPRFCVWRDAPPRSASVGAAEGGGVFAQILAHRDRRREQQKGIDAEGAQAAHLPGGDGVAFVVGEVVVPEERRQFAAATAGDFAAAAQIAHQLVELEQAHGRTCFGMYRGKGG